MSSQKKNFEPNIEEFLEKVVKNEEIKTFNKLINDDYKRPTLISDELVNFLNTKTQSMDTVHCL